MIPTGAGIPALARLDGAGVRLVAVEMGEFTVHVSLPEPWPDFVAAATEAGAVDFSGYYCFGPTASALSRARSARSRYWRTGVSVTRQPGASGWPWSRARRRPWPWLPGLDPFILMAHSSKDEICLVADGVTCSVTDQVLGSWLRQLPGQGIARRPLENPLVLLTCTEVASHQVLADLAGRMVWFPGGMTVLGTRPAAAARTAGAKLVIGLDGTGDDQGGRFRSVYPQGPAGDRVRWACRRRFASSAADWLVERSAVPGSAAPPGLRPQLFGSGRFRGLSYFDRRDRASRSAVLGSSRLGPAYVAWTPNPAYQPGAAAEAGQATGAARAEARPWDSRNLGELPFNAQTAVAVVGYFADGRFAVYDERQDISYWEAPRAFGLRLREDLAAAGLARKRMPSRVVLLTDFDAVPAGARADIARGLGGAKLITVNAPSTLFSDQHPGHGGPQARIALLPGTSGLAAPEWTSTTAAGISTRLFSAWARRAGQMRPAGTAPLRPARHPGYATRTVPDRPDRAGVPRPPGNRFSEVAARSPRDAGPPTPGRPAKTVAAGPPDAGTSARSAARGPGTSSGLPGNDPAREYLMRPSRRPMASSRKRAGRFPARPLPATGLPETAPGGADGISGSPPGLEHPGALMRDTTGRWVLRRGAVPTWAELETLAYQTVVRTATAGDAGRLDAAPGREAGRCVALALTWRDTLFPGGIAARVTADDLVADRRGLLPGLVAAGGWVRVEASAQVEAVLAGAARGLYAMVVWEPAGQVAGHATVWHAHRAGPTVRWMDLEAGHGRWMAPGGPPRFPAGHARAVFVSADAQVINPPAATSADAAGVSALLEFAPARPVTGNGGDGDEDEDAAGEAGEGEGEASSRSVHETLRDITVDYRYRASQASSSISDRRTVAVVQYEINDSPGQLIGVSGKRSIPGSVATPASWRFDARGDRKYDAECKVLEELAARLDDDSTGYIYIYSERKPCRSCESVIQQFQDMFSEISVYVITE